MAKKGGRSNPAVQKKVEKLKRKHRNESTWLVTIVLSIIALACLLYVCIFIPTTSEGSKDATKYLDNFTHSDDEPSPDDYLKFIEWAIENGVDMTGFKLSTTSMGISAVATTYLAKGTRVGLFPSKLNVGLISKSLMSKELRSVLEKVPQD